MKKIILILLLSIITINVNAKECSVNEMSGLAEHLDNMNYILEYAQDYKDEGKEGYFYLTFDHMPAGYKAEVGNYDLGFYILDSANVSAVLTGGIYRVNFFHEDCDFPIKTYEVRIPYYKNFCNDDDCKNDSWFDGTYENKIEQPTQEEDPNQANKTLIIVLVILVLILGGLVTLLVVKRSHKDE